MPTITAENYAYTAKDRSDILKSTDTPFLTATSQPGAPRHQVHACYLPDLNANASADTYLKSLLHYWEATRGKIAPQLRIGQAIDIDPANNAALLLSFADTTAAKQQALTAAIATVQQGADTLSNLAVRQALTQLYGKVTAVISRTSDTDMSVPVRDGLAQINAVTTLSPPLPLPNPDSNRLITTQVLRQFPNSGVDVTAPTAATCLQWRHEHQHCLQMQNIKAELRAEPSESPTSLVGPGQIAKITDFFEVNRASLHPSFAKYGNDAGDWLKNTVVDGKKQVAIGPITVTANSLKLNVDKNTPQADLDNYAKVLVLTYIATKYKGNKADLDPSKEPKKLSPEVPPGRVSPINQNKKSQALVTLIEKYMNQYCKTPQFSSVTNPAAIAPPGGPTAPPIPHH